jgi:hypothetical protein
VVALVPAIANALRGGSRFVSCFVRSFAYFATGVLNGRLCVGRSSCNFFARFFVACALVRVIGIASHANAENESGGQQNSKCDQRAYRSA